MKGVDVSEMVPRWKCRSLTLKGVVCRIPAQRCDEEGCSWCHVHDPKGTFQRQQREKRKSR